MLNLKIVHIVKFHYAGHVLAGASVEQQRSITLWFRMLENCLYEAATAVSLFDNFNEEFHRGSPFYGVTKQVANCTLPANYARTVPHIYAVAFVTVLFQFQQFLKQLQDKAESEFPEAGELIAGEVARFKSDFPELKKVRDSVMHKEDRSRRMKRGNKPLPGNQPLIMDVITEGNKFTTTTEDGVLGSIEVSRDSLIRARTILQACIDAFEWKGEPYTEPYGAI